MSKIIIKNDTTPATPSSGKTSIFIDSTSKKINTVDDAGTVFEYGAGKTDAEVKIAYENNADTNAFTDAEKTLLGNQSGSNSGDQTDVAGNSGTTDALNSATTIIDISAATAPTSGQVLTATASTTATWQDLGSGDFVSPASSTDNAIVRFDGTSGALGQNSTVIIDDIGRMSQTGLANSVYLGVDSGTGHTVSSGNNVGVGYESLLTNSVGRDNIAIGKAALYYNIASDNTAIGYQSMVINTSGIANTAIGKSSLQNNSTGSNNVAIGYGALLATSASNNTAMGKGAGTAVTTGTTNTIIGRGAAPTLTTGSSNIIIGDSIDVPLLSTSNYISIGDIFKSDNTVASTTIPLAPPQYATGSIPAAAAGNEGSLVYDTTTNEIKFSDASTWSSFGGTTVYSNPDPSYTNAELFGLNAAATGSSSLSVGTNASAPANSVALGYYCIGTGTVSVQIGWGANARTNGVAIGYAATMKNAFDIQGTSVGSNSKANTNAVALGYTATVNTLEGMAIGAGSDSTNSGVAIGYLAQSLGNHSIALGNNATTVSYTDSIAIGEAATVAANNSISIGGVFLSDNTVASTSIPFATAQYATGSIPTAAAGNEGAIVYDTTTNEVKFSDGSAWDTFGSKTRNVETITAATDTLDSGNDTVLADGTSNAITLTLPAAASSTGVIYNIKKVDSTANDITIDGNGAETIDGATTQIISTQYDSITIHCDGSAWYII